MNHPTHLRTDHLSEAFGITNTLPGFSWTPPQGTVRQAAYQLTASNGWDTGRVDGGTHGFVPYGGPALGSRDRFDWTVRTWNVASDGTEVLLRLVRADGRGTGPAAPRGLDRAVDRPRRTGGSGTGGASRTMPCPKPSRWTPPPERRAPTPQPTASTSSSSTAQRVGDQQLTPGSTSYHSTLQVQAFDIARLLRAGTNTVRAVLTDGWYRGTFGYTRDADMYGHADGLPGAAGAGVRADSGRSSAPTARGRFPRRRSSAPTSWPASESTSGPRPTREQDARHAVLRDGSFTTLTGPVAPPTRIVEELGPVSITRLASGNQVVDLGQNINGWVRLSRLGAPGEDCHAGVRRSPGRLTATSPRTTSAPTISAIRAQFLGAGQVDSVVASGAPGEVFEPRHTTHGFQYVSVQGLDAGPGTGGHRGLHGPDRPGTPGHLQLQRRPAQQAARHCGVELPRQRLRGPHRLPAAGKGRLDRRLAAVCAHRRLPLRRGRFYARSGSRTSGPTSGTTAWSSTSLPRRARRSPRAEFMAFTNGSAGWGDAVVMVPWEIYLATGDTGDPGTELGGDEPLARLHPQRRGRQPAPGPGGGPRHAGTRTSSTSGTPASTSGNGWNRAARRRTCSPPGPPTTASWPPPTTGTPPPSWPGLPPSWARRTKPGNSAELSGNVRRAWQREYLRADGTVSTVAAQANCVRALAFDLVSGRRPAGGGQAVGHARPGRRHAPGHRLPGHPLPAACARR